MVKYKCCKCGAIAGLTDTCSIAPDLSRAGILASLMTRQVIHKNINHNTLAIVTLNIKRWSDATDNDGLVFEVLNMLRGLSEADIREYACSKHDWEDV